MTVIKFIVVEYSDVMMINLQDLQTSQDFESLSREGDKGTINYPKLFQCRVNAPKRVLIDQLDGHIDNLQDPRI